MAEMDHLDLAGIMTTPPQWNTPVFDQQDAIYLSSSRQMLEPIMEETSEDEEYALNSWNQYDSQLSDGGGGDESTCSGGGGGRGTSCGASFWSSAESDTGSVIRVEVTKDNDSNSERDILCPAKRPRRCEEALSSLLPSSAEDEVILRRPMGGDLKNNSLERFLNYENFARDSWGNQSQQRNSLGNRRTGGGFDDFYSDSDSLSYNSLSRSSSLIQFESLERQLLLQEQHASMTSLGNSSPSLLSFDIQNSEETAAARASTHSSSSGNNSASNSRRGSQSSLLKKYESLDGRLHQTYYDLDKLDFDDMESATTESAFSRTGANLKLSTHLAELRSDSESSSEGSEGSTSRPQSVLSPCDSVDNEFLKKFHRTHSQQSKKGKSSAENLSEDSGYCEPLMGFGIRRSKSQNLCKNYEKFSEEDEEMMEHKSIALTSPQQQQQQQQHVQMFIELKRGGEEDEATEVGEKAKHSNNNSNCGGVGGEGISPSSNEFKNTNTRHQHPSQSQYQHQTPPSSPLLDYMRHQQRHATHSPSPVSSEVSTSSTTSSKNSASSSASAASASSSGSSSSSSSSSATTCASKASFTWLMPSSQTAAGPSRVYDRQENSLRISLNDLRERKTSNGKDDDDEHVVCKSPSPTPTTTNRNQTKQVNCSSLLNEENERIGGGVPTNASAFINEEYRVNDENEDVSGGDVNEIYPENLKNLCEKCYTRQQFQNFNCQYCQNSTKNNFKNNHLKVDERICFKIQENRLANPETLEYLQNGLRDQQPWRVDNFENSGNKLYFNSSQTLQTPEGLEYLKANSKEQIWRVETLTTAPSKASYLNSSESDYSPPGLRRNCWNLMQNWPERTSSVPNELNNLGRKKKYKRSRNKIPKFTSNAKPENDCLSDTPTSSEDSEKEANPINSLKRSSSWCFEFSKNSIFSVNPINLTEFPYSTQEPAVKDNKPLGFIHQSYHNLALLDLDFNSAEQKMSEKRISSDYEEDIVCKSNFLLDELSAHYDKTASILNDRPVSAERVVVKVADVEDSAAPEDANPKPKPPQRRRKSSNSSYSETENTDDDQVQHVQLVIRKPPARQKRHQQDKEKSNSLTQDFTFTALMQPNNQDNEKTNSLTQDFTFTALMQPNKTFDQDPTMLQTSYAQSLEKCNFDCREISNSDLSRTRTMPKRRFHSQANAAKKKNLVSSTPNLNAYQGEGGEIEDDMYVSSATTSMHQLPLGQTQKPLGILLPAGSRTSFGKEVSFCPVVSKYSWQEQSSEECHEEGDLVPSVLPGEESDDELLDNCDAVVLKNTKENEIIGTLFKDEAAEPADELKEKTTEESSMKEKYKAVIKELPTLRQTTRSESSEKEEHSKEHNVDEEQARQREALRAATQPTAEPPRELVEAKQESCNAPTNIVALTSETLENETYKDDDGATEFITTATFSLTTNVNNETLNAKPDTLLSSSSTSTPSSSTANNKPELLLEQQQQQQQKRVKAIKPTIVIARPISIQLPILSEPPINRAHHILYASQQMLDNFQRHQETENYEHSNKSQSVQNLNRMSGNTSSAATGTMGSSASSGKINNNNEIMKSKFKADEKHPNSKGFLSRLSNGFRFSMRRNKKKLEKKEEQQTQQAQEQQQPQQVLTANSKKPNGTPVKSAKNSSKNAAKSLGNNNQQPDYIYIPLKGPLPEKYETGFFESHGAAPTNTNGNTVVDAGGKSTAKANGNASANGNSSKLTGGIVQKKGGKQSKTSEEKKVTGKPPLPPQQLQLQQQQQQQQQKSTSANSAQQQQQIGSSRFYTQELGSADAGEFSAQQQQQQPPTIRGSTEDFLASERYHSQRHQQSFANDAAQHNGEMTSAAAVNYDFGASPSRASVSQKTQMFNNLSSRNSAVEPKIGLIETNLDTHETVITGKTRSLMNIGPHENQLSGKRLHNISAGAGAGGGGADHHHLHQHGDYYDDNDDDEVVVRPDGSVVVIKNAVANGGSGSQAQIASVRRPHKSMEFLLDKENQKDVMPPENELQKSHDHNPAALSEHQLRIQASLQRLNIPDWFRQYNQKSPEGAGSGPGTYKPGNFTRKRTQDSGRWAGLNSKTTSLSSLGSQRSDRSPLLLSPSAHSHHGGQTATGHGQHHGVGVGAGGHTGAGTGASGGAFSRWSTSHLNSSQTSPSVSQRGSFSRGGPINSSFISVNSGHSVIRNSMRQPYLGWRSQEKLSQRTAHERLASSLLSQQQQQQRTSPTSHTPTAVSRKLQPVTPEIQSSIKEVTSAIVHYVNDQTNQQRSRSTSPNSSYL